MLNGIQKDRRLLLGAIVVPALFVGAILYKSVLVSLVAIPIMGYFFPYFKNYFSAYKNNQRNLVRNDAIWPKKILDETRQYLPSFMNSDRVSNESAISPENFQDVAVIKSFTGKNNAQHDLRLFGQWYPQDIVQSLMFFQKNDSNAVRVLFTHPDFMQELTQFKMLLNNLQRPGIFVAMEPGVGQNHFIFGVIYQNNLLLINPVGETRHKDFYANVNKLIETKLFSDVMVSTTKIQRDPAGLVSCGPICVELCQHFSQFDIKELFEVLEQNAQKLNNDKYYSVNIQAQLPGRLLKLVNLADALYQESIVNLRQTHLQQLLRVCKSQGNTHAANASFEAALNNDAQTLLRKMILGDITVVDLDDTPEYNRLVADVKSNSQYKLKTSRK